MSNLFDCDWNLTEVARILTEDMTKEDKMEDLMTRASRKAELTRNQLLDILFEKGVLAVYNLGMQHMYEYLEK